MNNEEVHGVWRESFERDEYLARFLNREFEPSQFLHTTFHAGSAAIRSTIHRLDDGLKFLDKELNKEVGAHHYELLQHVGSIEQLDADVAFVKEKIHGLKMAVTRVNSELLDPFRGLKQSVLQLSRMQVASDTLRRLGRFLNALKKLRTIMETGPRDPLKASQCLLELESILAEVDLTGYDVVDQELPWIRSCGREIRDGVTNEQK
eukprot:GILJ01006724.1.p1 GENE.GILJ01006724.1~~GILJ01006724.1.p1  ORF type:complete len:206 (+),score=25.30 GILJ01006724.1:151-768(+)